MEKVRDGIEVFYGQQTNTKSDGKDEDIVLEYINDPIVKVDPVTPKSATPEPPRAERRVPDMGPKQELAVASLVLISRFKEMKSRGLSGSNYKTLKSMLLELLTYTDPYDRRKSYIEAGKDFVLDVANLEMDTPPDFQLSQLEFESQESFLAWGGVDGK
ncbi:hypothetical protein Tco_1242221 [Tanacetum coccineum]